MIFPTVMWIDPGDMTGIAWLLAGGTSFQVTNTRSWTPPTRSSSGAPPTGSTLAIGWERYTIRRDKPQTHAYDALGIIGCARYFSAYTTAAISCRQPSSAPPRHSSASS